MSRTISTCKVCDEHSIDCEPPMVECVECRFYFHQYCAIDSESIDESSIDEDQGIDSKHCPKCQGEYIEPEDERFIEGYTEALSIAKVKKLTLNLVEPLCRFEYIKNHLLNLQTISSASDEAIEALAKTKFNLNIGFKDDRLNSQLHRATKETIKELFSSYDYLDNELDLSSFAVIEDEVIEELMDINYKSLSFWMCTSDDLEYFAEELECDIKVSEGIVIIALRDDHEKITGLKVGDVIVRCNESPVLSEEDVNSQTKNNETLNLIVNRVGKEVKLTIDLNQISPELTLNGLIEITNKQAKELSFYNGKITLNGIKEINDSVAQSFSKHQGDLELSGLTELSDSVAESLSTKAPGGLPEVFDTWYRLYLDGLTELSDATAEFLSKHKGKLFLCGVEELSKTAVESLSKHQGGLYLDSLNELNDTATETLSKSEGALYLGLNELSKAAAESLSKHKGYLGLNGVTELRDAVAESLSKNKGYLGLNGVTELSDVAAESLSKHKGDLGLEGVTELSDAAAEFLSKHKGDLDLDSLEELSDAAAGFLSKHQGKICYMDPKEWVVSLKN